MNSDDLVSRTAQIRSMTPFASSNITDHEQKDKEIFERNNIRLQQLANELRDISSYGSACDELLLWIKDSRAYNIYNESALLECISVIRDKAMEYGPWSGMQTLKIVNEHSMMLSQNGQQHIKKCYYELHKLVLKRRPSDTSVVSTGSAAQRSTPSSPMGQRSIVSPQSPIDVANAHNARSTNNSALATSFPASSINSLVKSLLESGIPQSPASTVDSPQVSPNVTNRTAVYQSPQQSSSALVNNVDQQAIYNTFTQNYEKQRTQQMHQQQVQQRPQYQQQSQHQRRSLQNQPQYQQLVQQPQYLQQLQQLQKQYEKQQQYQQKAAQAQQLLKQQHQQQQQDLQKKQQQQQAAQQQQQQQQLQLQQLQQQQLQQKQQQLQQHQQIAQQQYQQYYRQFCQAYSNNMQPSSPGQNPTVQEFVRQYSNPNVGSALQVHQQQQRQDTTRIQNHWPNSNQNMVQSTNSGIGSASNSAPNTPVTGSFSGINIASSPVNQTFIASPAYPSVTSTTQPVPPSTSQSIVQPILLNSATTDILSGVEITASSAITSVTSTGQPVYANSSPSIVSNTSAITIPTATTTTTTSTTMATTATTPTTPTTPTTTIPITPITPITTTTPTTPTTNNNDTATSVNNTGAKSLLSKFFPPLVTSTTHPVITTDVVTSTTEATTKRIEISQGPPMRTNPTNFYLPSLPQADINTIHLPGGGISPKPQKFQKLSDAYSDMTYDDPDNDQIEYYTRSGYLAKPFTLVHDMAITKKVFYISPMDYQRLYIPERVKTLSDLGGNLALRFIFNCWHKKGAETKCEWPSQMHVEINNHDMVLQRKSKKPSPNNLQIYNKDGPYNLTPQVRKGENILKIHQIGCCCNYHFSISTYTCYSYNYIFRLVKNTGIPIKETYDLIDSLLGCYNKNDDNDDDIVIVQSSVKLGLRCPISLARINRPVRSKNCKHVGAFDLDSYLITNKKKENATWRCPHCNCATVPEDLRRDLMMESLLKELRKNVAEIEYFTNHNHFKITKVDDPDTDDEDDTETKTVKYEKVVEPSVDIIDLISDDDDDEQTETASGTNSNIINNTLVPSKRARVA